MIYVKKPYRLLYPLTRKQLVMQRLSWLMVTDFYYDTSSPQTKAYYDELIEAGYARLYWEDDGAHAPTRLITATDAGCKFMNQPTSLFERLKKHGDTVIEAVQS
jgi:hypothetical protein